MNKTRSLQTKKGLMKAKQRGVKCGRPSIPKHEVIEIQRLKREGFKIRELSSITEYSIGCIQRHTKGIK